MEAGVGVGGAVRRHQELGPVEVGGLHRHQPDLAGPLGQLALRLGRRLRLPGGLRPVEEPRPLPWAAVEVLTLGLLRRLDGGLVIGRGLPLHKGDGPGGAGGQAVPQPVAVVVPQQLGLPVHHADGTLVAGVGAGAAAVAFFLVNMNDLPDQIVILLFVVAGVSIGHPAPKVCC